MRRPWWLQPPRPFSLVFRSFSVEHSPGKIWPGTAPYAVGNRQADCYMETTAPAVQFGDGIGGRATQIL